MWLDRHMCQCNGNASASCVPYRFPGSSPCFRDFNTHTVFPNPLGFTSTLCWERLEHCHSLSAHLSCHSWKDQKNMLWDCVKPQPLITNGFKSVEVHKPVATWDKNLGCAFPGLPYAGCSTAYNAAHIIQFNIPEACIRCTSSWISELDFL